jgi:hypothetical protein
LEERLKAVVSRRSSAVTHNRELIDDQRLTAGHYRRTTPQKYLKIIFTLHLICRMLTAANLLPAEF